MTEDRPPTPEQIKLYLITSSAPPKKQFMVAVEAGVSTSQVSLYMNRKPGVSTNTTRALTSWWRRVRETQRAATMPPEFPGVSVEGDESSSSSGKSHPPPKISPVRSLTVVRARASPHPSIQPSVPPEQKPSPLVQAKVKLEHDPLQRGTSAGPILPDRPKSKWRAGHIYVMKDLAHPEAHRCKIGRSVDVHRRQGSLSAGSIGLRAVFSLLVKDYVLVETAVHTLLAAKASRLEVIVPEGHEYAEYLEVLNQEQTQATEWFDVSVEEAVFAVVTTTKELRMFI